jgi:hypothetical protein
MTHEVAPPMFVIHEVAAVREASILRDTSTAAIPHN